MGIWNSPAYTKTLLDISRGSRGCKESPRLKEKLSPKKSPRTCFPLRKNFTQKICNISRCQTEWTIEFLWTPWAEMDYGVNVRKGTWKGSFILIFTNTKKLKQTIFFQVFCNVRMQIFILSTSVEKPKFECSIDFSFQGSKNNSKSACKDSSKSEKEIWTSSWMQTTREQHGPCNLLGNPSKSCLRTKKTNPRRWVEWWQCSCNFHSDSSKSWRELWLHWPVNFSGWRRRKRMLSLLSSSKERRRW